MKFILRHEIEISRSVYGFFKTKKETTHHIRYVTKIKKNDVILFEYTENREEAYVFKKDEEYLALTTPVLLMHGGVFFKEEV